MFPDGGKNNERGGEHIHFIFLRYIHIPKCRIFVLESFIHHAFSEYIYQNLVKL